MGAPARESGVELLEVSVSSDASFPQECLLRAEFALRRVTPGSGLLRAPRAPLPPQDGALVLHESVPKRRDLSVPPASCGDPA